MAQGREGGEHSDAEKEGAWEMGGGSSWKEGGGREAEN